MEINENALSSYQHLGEEFYFILFGFSLPVSGFRSQYTFDKLVSQITKYLNRVYTKGMYLNLIKSIYDKT